MCWWRRICYSRRPLSSEILILYSFVYHRLHPSGVWSRKTPQATSKKKTFALLPQPSAVNLSIPSFPYLSLFPILFFHLPLSLLQLFNSFSPLLSVPILTPFLALSLNCNLKAILNSGWRTTMVHTIPCNRTRHLSVNYMINEFLRCKNVWFVEGIMMVGGAYMAEWVPSGRLNPASLSKWFPTRLYFWLLPNSSGWVNGMWSLCGLFTLLERLCHSHRRPGVECVWRHRAWPSWGILLVWFSQFWTLYKALNSTKYITLK